MFVENDIQRIKSYEIDFLISKRATTRRKSKYLIRWKEYESEYDEWRNISKFNDVMNLIKNYEQVLIEIIFLLDRLKLFFTSSQFVSVFSSIRRLKLSFTSQKFVSVVVSITTLILLNQRFVVVISLRKTLLDKFNQFTSFVNSSTSTSISNALIRRFDRLKKNENKEWDMK